MLKKTIEYVDYNGNPRKEDFYFNLSEAELAKMELSVTGGYAEMLQRIIDARDMPEIASVFENLISKSYGEKSLDGRRFVKSKEISDTFMQTPAYDILYMEMMTDVKAASDFINGITPNVEPVDADANKENNITPFSN